MIIVLHGHDELGIRRRIAELREQADGGTGLLDSNATTIEGRDAKADEILGAALTVPFLAPHRFVLVSGLLGRFGSGERPPEGRGAGRAPSIEPFEPLFAQLNEGLPETTILVFEDGPLSERNAFLARLRAIEGTEVEFFAELKAADLVRFIRDEASARGVRFRAGKSTRPLEPGDEWQRPGESDPAQLLAALYPGDTLALSQEIAKLALYTLGREATVDDVDALCGGERETTVWQLIDATMDGELEKAITALVALRDAGQNQQGLLALIASSYRTAATVLDLLDDGAGEEEIGKAIRRPWPGLRRRAIERAQRLGRDGLLRAYETLVEADRTMKLGEVDEDLATELAIMTLLTLSPKRPARV